MGLFDKLKGKDKGKGKAAAPSKRRDSISSSSSGNSDSPYSDNKNHTTTPHGQLYTNSHEKEQHQTYPSEKSYEIGPPPFPPPQFEPPPIDHQRAAQEYADDANRDAPPPGAPPGYTTQAAPGLSLGLTGGPGRGNASSANINYHPPGYAAPPRSIFEPLYSHAPDEERDWGDAFTNAYTIYPARFVQPFEREAFEAGHIMLVSPPELEFPYPNAASGSRRFKGEIQQRLGEGTAFVRTKKKCKDTTFVSSLPLFSPHLCHLSGGGGGGGGGGEGGLGANRKSIYFEILITELKDPEEASAVIGFTCLPYPSFRLPGWHRGSVAVHSDDGRRYVNDSLSGKPFVRAFKAGETIGLGLNLDRMVCYLTRNGKFELEWSLIADKQPGRGIDPDRNYCDGGIAGLEGDRDIYGAVGVFGAVGVVVNWTGMNQPFMYKG